MLSNNKFLGKCWYGWHPWIRLPVECGSMVEKGINFIFCLGTAYDILAWKVLGTARSFLLTGKACHAKLLSLFFALSSGTTTNLYFAASPFPLQGKNQRKIKK